MTKPTLRNGEGVGEFADGSQLAAGSQDRDDAPPAGRPPVAPRRRSSVGRISLERGAQVEPAYPSVTQRPHPTHKTRASERWEITNDGEPLPEVAFILKEDPDLAEGLGPKARRAALELFRAREIRVERTCWQPPRLNPHTTYGLLLLNGLLGRRVSVGDVVSTELLGRGDILRPCEEPCLWNVIPPTFEWRVFRPTRLAVLDERITRLIGQRPELVVSFSSRLLRRARYAEYLMAVTRFRHVEHRLLVTLWHLASNWGCVTPTGIRVPFHLTHAVLGEIVGARRPSVTTAIHRLHRLGQVTPEPDGGYLLTGDPADAVPGLVFGHNPTVSHLRRRAEGA